MLRLKLHTGFEAYGISYDKKAQKKFGYVN